MNISVKSYLRDSSSADSKDRIATDLLYKFGEDDE